jgi:hypothetical protein
MKRRYTKAALEGILQTASGLTPHYMTIPEENASPPYLVWLISDTEFTADDMENTVARDDIRVYLCTLDYDEAAELGIVRAFPGCNVDISRVYNSDEHLHISMITVTLYGKI